MKTKANNIRYIVVHIIPACDWRVLNYADKMQFHYIVTASGKNYPLKSLDACAGCIDIAFVGSDLYAQHSQLLFGLLLDLWMEHQDAKIVYASDLYHHRSIGPFEAAARWLSQHIPHKANNLAVLKTAFPTLN